MTYILGIDIGGTNIKLGLTDHAGNILHKTQIKTQADALNQDEIVRNIIASAEGLLTENGIVKGDVEAVGIGSPGTPDNLTGTLVYASNLPFKDVPLRKMFNEAFGVPVYVVNDANAAALAETRIGAGRDCQSSVTITIGTGIGGGVVIRDRVYAGFNDAGAELGHTTIMLDGDVCTCGRKGCFERYASAAALGRQTEAAAKAHPESLLAEMVAANDGRGNGRIPFEAMNQGCAVGKAVVDQYIYYLTEGLANFVNAFMPEILIIGGGVSHEGQYFLDMLVEPTLEKSFLFGNVRKPRFALAELGNGAGISGAALYALDCVRDGIPG